MVLRNKETKKHNAAIHLIQNASSSPLPEWNFHPLMDAVYPKPHSRTPDFTMTMRLSTHLAYHTLVTQPPRSS